MIVQSYNIARRTRLLSVNITSVLGLSLMQNEKRDRKVKQPFMQRKRMQYGEMVTAVSSLWMLDVRANRRRKPGC